MVQSINLFVVVNFFSFLFRCKSQCFIFNLCAVCIRIRCGWWRQTDRLSWVELCVYTKICGALHSKRMQIGWKEKKLYFFYWKYLSVERIRKDIESSAGKKPFKPASAVPECIEQEPNSPSDIFQNINKIHKILWIRTSGSPAKCPIDQTVPKPHKIHNNSKWMRWRRNHLANRRMVLTAFCALIEMTWTGKTAKQFWNVAMGHLWPRSINSNDCVSTTRKTNKCRVACQMKYSIV